MGAIFEFAKATTMISKFNQILPLFVALALVNSPMVLSEERPDSFFKKDYLSESQKPQKPKAKKAQKESSLSNDQKVDQSPKNILDQEEGEVESGSLAYLEEKGIPIRTIGVVINGRNREHFAKHVGNLVHVASSLDLIVSQVAAVGMFVPGKENPLMDGLYFSPQALGLIALQGQLAPYLEVPKKFDIDKSPTWVLNTAEGTVLIEGLDQFWLYLNRKGEYVNRDIDDVMAQAYPMVNALDDDLRQELDKKPLFSDEKTSSRKEDKTISADPKGFFKKQ